MFFPHLKPPPNEPNSEEAPREPCLMTCSIIRMRHPMSPAAIHPVPPPNGQGKGRIKFYYYTRPCICFFPTRNPHQLHPTVNKHPQHQFWWCLHVFTYPALPELPPACPALLSGIHGIKNTPTHSYRHTLPSPSIPGCIQQVTEIWVVGSYRCAYIRPMGRCQHFI